MKNLNVRPETVQPLEENLEVSFLRYILVWFFFFLKEHQKHEQKKKNEWVNIKLIFKNEKENHHRIRLYSDTYIFPPFCFMFISKVW